MTTLASAGGLLSTLADARQLDHGAPRVSDLEVYGDGVTFVASGSVTGFGGGSRAVNVQLRAKGVVRGECLSPDGSAPPRPFAVPLVLAGSGQPKPIKGGEATFFARTEPPRLAGAEVCPNSEWAVAVAEVDFIGVKLQIGREAARLLCQFPAIDGPVLEPGCHLQP